MARLSYVEKEIIVKALEMESGYVSDFTNRQFQDFIKDVVGIDIYAEKYSLDGNSKAKRLKSFWALEPNYIVGKVLKELLEREKLKSAGGKMVICAKGIQIANSLLSQSQNTKAISQKNEGKFLSKDFGVLNISDINISDNLKNIINNRLKEIELCINNNIYLSAIILSEKFSEMMQLAINKYINGLITNAEVIEELIKMAKEIKDGSQPIDGLNDEETAFYDALTKPPAV